MHVTKTLGERHGGLKHLKQNLWRAYIQERRLNSFESGEWYLGIDLRNRFDQIHIMMVFVERASGRQNHRRWARPGTDGHGGHPKLEWLGMFSTCAPSGAQTLLELHLKSPMQTNLYAMTYVQIWRRSMISHAAISPSLKHIQFPAGNIQSIYIGSMHSVRPTWIPIHRWDS